MRLTSRSTWRACCLPERTAKSFCVFYGLLHALHTLAPHLKRCFDRLSQSDCILACELLMVVRTHIILCSCLAAVHVLSV